MAKTALTVSTEELLFRGYFLRCFCPALGDQGAVLLSSFMFALAHAPSMLRSGLSPAAMAMGLLSWFVLGVALGMGFLRTGGLLWFPWALHCAYNLGYSLVSFCLAAAYGRAIALVYGGPLLWTGHPSWAPESGLAGLLLELAILAAVWLVTADRDGV